VLDDLLDKADTNKGSTVWSALKPVSEAIGSFKFVPPIETGIPNLFLLPGDIRLSEFETDLAEFWGQCLQRKLRGFRGTSALSEFVNEVAAKIDADYVFYDSGPNIGPLNRVIVLDCDFLIVPVACDLFSLRALKTLGRTLVSWIRDWQTIADLAPEGITLLKGKPALMGTFRRDSGFTGMKSRVSTPAFFQKLNGRFTASSLSCSTKSTLSSLPVGFAIYALVRSGTLVP